VVHHQGLSLCSLCVCCLAGELSVHLQITENIYQNAPYSVCSLIMAFNHSVILCTQNSSYQAKRTVGVKDFNKSLNSFNIFGKHLHSAGKNGVMLPSLVLKVAFAQPFQRTSMMLLYNDSQKTLS